MLDGLQLCDDRRGLGPQHRRAPAHLVHERLELISISAQLHAKTSSVHMNEMEGNVNTYTRDRADAIPQAVPRTFVPKISGVHPYSTAYIA